MDDFLIEILGRPDSTGGGLHGAGDDGIEVEMVARGLVTFLVFTAGTAGARVLLEGEPGLTRID